MAHNSESKLKENIELHSLDLRKEKYYIQGWISLPIKSFFFLGGGGNGAGQVERVSCGGNGFLRCDEPECRESILLNTAVSRYIHIDPQ